MTFIPEELGIKTSNRANFSKYSNRRRLSNRWIRAVSYPGISILAALKIASISLYPVNGWKLNGRYRMSNVVILSEEFPLVQAHSNEGNNSLPRLTSHPSIFYSFWSCARSSNLLSCDIHPVLKHGLT
jgi:hypothetical protein